MIQPSCYTFRHFPEHFWWYCSSSFFQRELRADNSKTSVKTMNIFLRQGENPMIKKKESSRRATCRVTITADQAFVLFLRGFCTFWASLRAMPYTKEGLYHKCCRLYQNLQTHWACTTGLCFLMPLDLNCPGLPRDSRYEKRSILCEETFSLLRIQPLCLMGIVFLWPVAQREVKWRSVYAQVPFFISSSI